MFNKPNLPIFQYRLNFLRLMLTFLCPAVLMLLVAGTPDKASAAVTSGPDFDLPKVIESGKIDSTKIYKNVEQMPKVIGGVKAIYKHITYPKQAVKAGVEGRVFLKFVVNQKGDVQDLEVLRGIGSGCDKAAIAALKKVKFKPGVHKGEKVNVQYSLPVTFKIKS